MKELVKTIKLHIYPDNNAIALFKDMTMKYRDACNFISEYVFNNNYDLNFIHVQDVLYHDIRDNYGLKSQLAISAIKTVTASYKTVKEQLHQHPYKYVDADGSTVYIDKDLGWLWKPIKFNRPQADLVRRRDYSFIETGRCLSINTLGKRVKLTYDLPDCFKEYFDSSWSFGTAKLVNLKGKWYLHIPVSKTMADNFDPCKPTHVVGIDRGLRFLYNTYDEKGHSIFYNGKEVIDKRNTFNQVRAELQSRDTKSAKRKLKALSGRENRWMSDVNHQISKTLTETYDSGTLFVLENLENISFNEDNLSRRNKKGRNQIRSWSFYQLEQDLIYKASESGSWVIKVEAKYTSQRCPKCGRIHKQNRNYKLHEYKCDSCGYTSNDDRIGAMNLYELGMMYVFGDKNPHFVKGKSK